MEHILIDTDVVLDLLFDRKPFSDQATIVFSLCEAGKIKGFVTPVILSNVYYLLRKIATHEKVIQKLDQLCLIIDILNTDRQIVLRALKSGFSDFEDAIQNFSAEQSGQIHTIITRNTKDFKKSSLPVLTPDAYIKQALL